MKSLKTALMGTILALGLLLSYGVTHETSAQALTVVNQTNCTLYFEGKAGNSCIENCATPFTVLLPNSQVTLFGNGCTSIFYTWYGVKYAPCDPSIPGCNGAFTPSPAGTACGYIGSPSACGFTPITTTWFGNNAVTFN